MTSIINASTSSGIVQTADTSGILQLQTASTTAVTIDASQNVGIGTASPSGKLDVIGTIRAGVASNQAFNAGWSSGGSQVYIQGYNSGTAQYVDTAVRGDNLLFYTNAASNTERMRITTAGNVGIGTTTPYVPLQVTGTIKVATGNAQGILSLGDGNGASTNCGVYRGAAGAPTTDGNYLNIGGYDGVVFTTGNAAIASQTERMRIDSIGQLLVGVTSQFGNGYGNLQVYQTDAGKNGMAIKFNPTAGTLYMAAFYVGANALVGSINSNGTTTAYSTTSDYRLKENVQPMTGALAKVSALKPVTYSWKSNGSSGEGFIAHELQAIVTDAVTGEKDAVHEDGSVKAQSIDTSFLVATLTAAIQEQQALITQLQADVAALKGAK